MNKTKEMNDETVKPEENTGNMGKTENEYYGTLFPSPVGELLMVCTDEAIVGLWMELQMQRDECVVEDMLIMDEHPLLVRGKEWLDRYFAGENPDPRELPLAPMGGTFRQMVWTELLEIPYGKVTTYGEIARKIAVEVGKKKMSAQAVGGAVGHNPISIIIPCHRVVGKSGSLIGYGGGLENKEKLLRHEGVDMQRYYVPKVR